MSSRIDVVYTWVDNEDIPWQEKKEKAFLNHPLKWELEWYANVNGRFRNNNELQYSLRSLEKYFPEHGNIFIITDWQTPKFLKKHKHIHIIDHKDFIPHTILPTFSSKKIELFIPHIPQISETFLYMNDDVFFWPKWNTSDFLWETPIYYFFYHLDTDTPLKTWQMLIWDMLMSQKYPSYELDFSYSAHSPKVINKKSFSLMEQEFKDVFQKLEKEVFRETSNPSIIADLYPRWMVFTGKGKNGGKKWEYYRTSERNYIHLLKQFENIPFLCINDTSDNVEKSNEDFVDLQKVLEKLYPHKSSFEL
jgi:hypothetical protein